ncbi:MATE family efflux transporter [Paramaledivibacter caminithermalis]|jgi:putative MATE family efflux protein|uniref:Probable multidrug resistance protein NorM n=1 Tax=Paramaledivibacter caminithermalis (strain DSM 15212 / CIP 107654 / DViRD3) TaxID=1121301 RepID=A0A1M6MT29_PARC5|nr:MATE family efflux transporter [Paramaledivibacter caminithermalis]SHJ86668.1 putative efflux protein, MATE family [Paramaledivibacter caminithermalis DSM 15212]
MTQEKSLISGNIFNELIKLAIPIMGTSFLQMAYSMTDMIWIGRVGSRAVAAVGTAGFFPWLAIAFIRISQIGAEVGVAQSIGKDDIKGAKGFARSALQLDFIIALLYGIFLILFRKPLIGFFKIEDAYVVNRAIDYLSIIGLGTVFSFANPVFTSVFNGAGKSKPPFLINSVGLIANMILDPLLIFGIGPLPGLGVRGAAIATITAQLIVTIIFLLYVKKDTLFLSEVKFYNLPELMYIKKIVKLGFPATLQSGMFTIFAMIIARIIANWGPIPIAVQKVGSQIESISWMTAHGFATALSAFVGQNYGAGKIKRVYRGYFTALGIMSIIGVCTSLLLILFAKPIFTIFIPEDKAIVQGVIYLRILGVSQFFMCIEITTTGAFNGLGKTLPPSLISIIFTGLRIPAALMLSKPEILGLNGVWWSISLSSVIKGIILVIWFGIVIRKQKITEDNNLEP